MITGDYHHTAIAVAKDVGMVKPGRETVVIDTTQQQQLQPKSSLMSSQFAGRAAAPSNTVLPWGIDPQVALGDTSQYLDDGMQLRPTKPHHQLTMQVGVQLCVRVRCLQPALPNQSPA